MLVRLETIEAAYEVWAGLRRDVSLAHGRFLSERQRLEDQGALMLGAVRTASATVSSEAPEGTGLAIFVTESKAKLDAARAALEAAHARELESLTASIAEISSTLRARIERQASLSKPTFRVMVRTMPAGRRILHAERLSGDDAVTAFFVLSAGRVPSRYGYLFDDSTDDVSAVPAWLYADEGVTPSETRPSPSVLATMLGSRPLVWPLKGMLPFSVPSGRWLQRGPVMEAEVADGGGDVFRNLLTQDEAERIVGLLLALKLANRIDLELL